MIETTTGAFTVVNIAQPVAAYFWNGHPLKHVTALAAMRKPNGDRRVVITVIDPARVLPALDLTEQAALNDIYNQMSAAGIIVQRARH